MTLNRVAVTDYGLTSPIGNTPGELWNNLHDGKTGVGSITGFDNPEIPVHNAGETHDFPFSRYFIRKDKNRMDQYSLYAVYATLEAPGSAKLDMDTVDRDCTDVIVSSGTDGLREMQEQVIRMYGKGIERIQPMFTSKALLNMAAGGVALHIGTRGVCKLITAVCASSNDATDEALHEIKFGYHDVILAGGTGSTADEIGIGGFNALTALSTTESLARSAIPFNRDRNGFVMGGGAGVLVLESLERAQKRGATILVEVVDYGSNRGAYHQTTPTPDGSGAAKVIELAIRETGISPEDVDYISAYDTSTQANEEGESRAIVTVLGKGVPVSSTKSFTDHLLGAAGTVEAVATIEALRHNYILTTAGTRELSEDIEANVVYGQGQETELEYAISSTFGFDGHDAVLVFKRWEA